MTMTTDLKPKQTFSASAWETIFEWGYDLFGDLDAYKGTEPNLELEKNWRKFGPEFLANRRKQHRRHKNDGKPWALRVFGNPE